MCGVSNMTARIFTIKCQIMLLDGGLVIVHDLKRDFLLEVFSAAD